VQPPCEVGAASESMGLLDEDQEGRLKRVFRVGRVAQDTPTDPQNHRSMPRHQHLEGGTVARPQEPVEQLVVRKPRDRPLDEEPIEVARGGPHCFDIHRPASFSKDRIQYPY
jgi:hypothetical protein